MEKSELQILSGVKILSFTQFLLGPAAVQYLSDMGADVIKIEPPGTGAWERTWSGADAFVNGVSVFYLLAHRNVRSLTLNLKHAEGKSIARRLVGDADVIVQNFRPGVMEKLGLGYEDVKEINPRIIYASASGYGKDSPYRDLPGQDLLLEAISGMMSITGQAGEMPVAPGAAVVDQHGAALLAMGILAALFHRARTGEGQEIDVTMLQSAIDLQMEPMEYFLNGATVERPREALGSAYHPAPYGVYSTKDGHIVLSLSPMRAVREALGGVAELAPYDDPTLAMSKREEIRKALGPFFTDMSTNEALALLQSHDVWCARVNNYEQVFADPKVRFLDPVMEIVHPEAGRVRLIKHPVRYGAGEPGLRCVPPALGENSGEILEELGLSADKIAELRMGGVI